MERTLVILKPDAIEKKLGETIFKAIEKCGLVRKRAEWMWLTDAMVREHYPHLADKPFFPRISAFMTRGACIVAIFEGSDAVHKVRDLAGATDPRQADPTSIRGLYGVVTPEGGMENVIHASATTEEAEQEISRFFR